MSLPRRLPLDPRDLLGGLLIPEPQTYVLAAPPLDLDPGRVHARLAPVITESFPRLCYRFPRRLGTWSGLVLADEPTAPVSTSDDDLTGPPRDLGDRHWELRLLDHDGLSVLALRFDHVLGHGELARRFLTSCCDALGESPGADPPCLNPAQQDRFRRLQAALIDRARESAPWADYRRLDLEPHRVRRLVDAMGMAFSEALTLWLAYHAQATNRAAGRPRPLEVLGFRMDPARPREPPLDPDLGNDGLLLERWEVAPDGAFERLDKGADETRRGLERFAGLYRSLPGKPLLDAALWLALAAARSPSPSGRDKLVVNNLGRTPYPFFRPVFFDPRNDADHLGLVYIDGMADTVLLQFAVPRRYLLLFPWTDFEQRLRDSLEDPEGWVAGRDAP